jgi:hypothetical protein
VVGDGQRLLLVVRHVQHGQRKRLLELADLLAHAPPQLRVEVRQRLVEEQHLGLEHERAGDRDALLLAAGELRGQPALEPGEPEHPELGRLRAVHAHRHRAVADVVQHRHVREQRVGLEHHRHVALVGGAQRDVGAADQHAALRHGLEPGDHPQRRRLAAARGPEQRDQLALRDAERHVVDGGDAAVALGHVLEHDAACVAVHLVGSHGFIRR